MTTTLNISEDFYSVQCEGITTGVPSYFIRLALCNMYCGSSQKTLNAIRKGLDTGKMLVPEKGASWVCDSIPVWLKGNEKEYNYVLSRWLDEGVYWDIIKGHVHVIWTGGEPCLIKNQNAITGFLDYIKKVLSPVCDELRIKYAIFNEIETNGTIVIKSELFAHLNQINCSPKLPNSGMAKNKRIVPDAISRIMEHENYQFKFVISNEDDIRQMFLEYINPFKIPQDRVVCMPGMEKQDQFFERTKWVLEMAKKYKFRGLTRLHIAAYNQVTGV